MRQTAQPRGSAADHAPGDDTRRAASLDLRAFLIRAAIVAGLAAVLFLAWQGRQALLLIFAAIVVAVIFDAASLPFRRWVGLSRRWSLAAAALVIAAAIGLLGWLVGARVAGQVDQLVSALRQAEPTIRSQLGLGGGGDQGATAPWLDWATSAASWGLGAVGAIGSVVLVVVAGYFLASEPGVYRRGAARLFPRDQRSRVHEAFRQGGAGLFRWLLGQLVSMTLVGLLVGIGTWVIGLPAPLALGLFAGLAGFVPVVGAVVGALPALGLAAAEGGSTLIWTGVLLIAVQQLESNMIMPLVEQRAVSIPPALLILNVFLFGAIFGGVGVIVAAPLTVAAFVLVKKLYLVDVLEEEAQLPAG